MKRLIFSIFLIIFVLSFSFGYCEAEKKKKIRTKHKIEFITKDKYILVGNLHLANPRTTKPLVIALHSFSMTNSTWEPLAEQLRQKGYNVLAMDLRGHGQSVLKESLKMKSRFQFSNSDWQKLPNDVIESINYVKANYPYINCNDVIIIGADLGASAGVIAGLNLKKEPLKFVMISPMIDFKGLYIPVKISRYKETKFMILLSKSDKVLFNFYTKTKPIIKEYPLSGPGNQLLKINKDAVNDIINFVVND